MKKYSVLLLYPDYLAGNYGEDTYYAHVEAPDVKSAQLSAQKEVVRENMIDIEYDGDMRPEHFAVLLVVEGHHYDLSEV